MKDKMLAYIKERGQATPAELVRVFRISRQLIHRHLKRLLYENKLIKRGLPPEVFYVYHENKELSAGGNVVELEDNIKKTIEENFSFIRPDGAEMLGTNGFVYWCKQRKLDIKKNAKQYVEIVEQYEKLMKNNFIDATIKIKNAFIHKQNLDSLHYLFFYSFPVFGRTKIANWLFFGKQLQQKDLIGRVLDICVPLIIKFAVQNKVECVAFVPPSVPRKLQFMKVLEDELQLRLPKIEIVKVQTPITIQQKSLKSIEDRITNAESTMFVEGHGNNFENMLIIDDFTGSGATLNVLAGKIKKQNVAKKVLGLTITGSVNGFEVVKEV